MNGTHPWALPALLFLAACGEDFQPDEGNGSSASLDAGGMGSGSGAGAGNGGDEGTPDMGQVVDMGDAMPMACELQAAECEDQQIAELLLFEEVSPDGITNESIGGGVFRSTIDARAGGLRPTQAYVYGRFTENGLEKVEVSDHGALESGEWDIGARRFVIRSNSGVAGPSCIGVARTAPGTEFEMLTAVPENLDFREEAYFTTPDCSLVSDGTGLGAPGTTLASFWTYRGCVEMTGNVYVLRLRDGRHIKLEVETYYSPEVQDYCDENGQLPGGGPSGSGNMQILWSFLD